MKKHLIKLLSTLLMAVMLLSVFAACGTEPTGTDVPNEDGSDIIDTGTDEDPKIPAKDYNEYNFTFITREGTAYNTEYLVSEGENSEVLNDAIFRRNKILEDKYNIKICQQNVSDIVTAVRTQVMGGATEFDAILASCQRLATLAQENVLYNLLDIERFDLSKSYWDNNANEQLKIGDKLYFTNCAMNIQTIGFIVLFNKQLIEDYELTSPYEYMENNQWTIDNWAKLVGAISKDVNQDGQFTEMDRYGTLYEHHNPRMFLYASGVRGTTNDENGYPQVTLMADADKTVNIYEKLKSVFSDTTTSYCMVCSNVDPHGYNNKWDYLRSLFAQDLYLFHYSGAGNLPQLADMESEFGIVPFPKYNEQQEGYKTMYQYNCNLFAIPSITEDIERTANIIEDMNYYSSFIVVPAWFDTLLARRYARDDESEESLRILRDNCVYDIGMYYDFGGLVSNVLDVDAIGNNISRNYARTEKAIQASIKSIYSKFEKAK